MMKKGRPEKGFSEQEIRTAMKRSNSNCGAARILNTSLNTYRKYATMYRDNEANVTLFELHKNSAGKGVRKFFKYSKEPVLTELLKEGMNITSYTTDKLKYRLIYEGLLEEKCSQCEFCEQRVTDMKVPLLLSFKDNNKTNWQIDNLELLCYNCYFLFVGDLFNKQQLGMIEDFGAPVVKTTQPDFELDEYFRKYIENIDKDDDTEEFVAKI